MTYANMSVVDNIFLDEDIRTIHELSEVLNAKSELPDVNGRVTFVITPTDRIRRALSTQLGLNLTNINTIPMRWIVGDTASHIDSAVSEFSNTYLVFLNDSPGELVLDSTSYPITQNTGFVFNEGIPHKTTNTSGVPRLLLGPMNELGEPVGNSAITYYTNETDAVAHTNGLGESYTSRTLGDISKGSLGGYPGAGNGWKVTLNSEGSSRGVFANGTTLNDDGWYFVYPAPLVSGSVACFVEGTRILTPDGYKAIEMLSPNDRVLTSDNRAVKFKHFTTFVESANERNAPYLVDANAFGDKHPERPLRLSPIHKVLVNATEGVWMSPEVASKTNPLVTQYGIGQPVRYYHLQCENYFTDNLVTEGTVTESYGPFVVSNVWIWNDTLGGFTRSNQGSVSL